MTNWRAIVCCPHETVLSTSYPLDIQEVFVLMFHHPTQQYAAVQRYHTYLSVGTNYEAEVMHQILVYNNKKGKIYQFNSCTPLTGGLFPTTGIFTSDLGGVWCRLILHVKYFFGANIILFLL